MSYAASAVQIVATAPRAATGHLNLSPKGLDTFRVLGPHRVAYLAGFEAGSHGTDALGCLHER